MDLIGGDYPERVVVTLSERNLRQLVEQLEDGLRPTLSRRIGDAATTPEEFWASPVLHIVVEPDEQHYAHRYGA